MALDAQSDVGKKPPAKAATTLSATAQMVQEEFWIMVGEEC